MSFSTRFVPHLTVILALAANACSAVASRPAEQVHTPVQCVGGTLASAADAALYSACDTVSGDLRISAADITDLFSLSRLRSVTGTLEISDNAQLQDLEGLERLGHVGGLAVRNNPHLSDLVALQGLTQARALVISGNPELESLRGLSGVTEADRVFIDDNGIYNTTGMSGLRRVGELVVANNPNLNSLQGFRSLATATTVRIHGNPQLCAMGMLPALDRVEGHLTVLSNRGLSKGDLRAFAGRVEGAGANQAVASGEPPL